MRDQHTVHNRQTNFQTDISFFLHYKMILNYIITYDVDISRILNAVKICHDLPNKLFAVFGSIDRDKYDITVCVDTYSVVQKRGMHFLF